MCLFLYLAQLGRAMRLASIGLAALSFALAIGIFEGKPMENILGVCPESALLVCWLQVYFSQEKKLTNLGEACIRNYSSGFDSLITVQCRLNVHTRSFVL
jgi:hypothetical protein